MPITVGEGWAYEILEHDTGGVWQWNGSQWIKPTGSAPPFGLAHGSWRPFEWYEEILDNFGASLERGYAYGFVMDVPTIIPHAIDWYAYAEATRNGEDLSSAPPAAIEFDANGDGLAFRVFKRWDSAGASSDASARSDPLGDTSLSQPDWCATPDNTGPEPARASKGYFVSEKVSVLKWAMTRA